MLERETKGMSFAGRGLANRVRLEVPGHDFGRTNKANGMSGALAPAGYFSASFATTRSFFPSLRSPSLAVRSLPLSGGAKMG